MARGLSYRDAVAVLGGDPPVVAALDRALGGALSVATGGLSEKIVNVFAAQPRFVGLGRDLLGRLRGSLHGVDRMQRTRRLEAATVVLAVTAYFEALGDAELPFPARELELSRDEQVRLATGATAGAGLGDVLLSSDPPQPAPHLAHEDLLVQLGQWYQRISTRLVTFTEGLAVWDGLDETQRERVWQVLTGLPDDAVRRFDERYGQLVVEVPEFRYWSFRRDQQATRAYLRWAMSDLASMLTETSAGSTPAAVVSALASSYAADLQRPVFADVDVGLPMPSLQRSYLDPDFRVWALAPGDNPSDDDAWSRIPARGDLAEYLAGTLTSAEASMVPLLVLGQPGAGKSVLTKVLAARLPAADFVPLRVVLREVPADADVQDQVEYAIRDATGQRIDWPAFTAAAGGALPVLLFDGYDELLQATGISQSDYLRRIARFQEREAQQGRPVAAVVTSRVAVADRMQCPAGLVALRLEPFRPDQIDAWIDRWNDHLGRFGPPDHRPLSRDAVHRQALLAAQPLLLLMLALYDAESDGLQQALTGQGGPTDESALYEELLKTFAAREVAKSAGPLPSREVAAHLEAELQQLSLVAFGMLSRRRQWVTEAELNADLTAVLGRQASVERGHRGALNQAELVIGRFFFIQRARTIRDGLPLQAYEFLHATFGEYLAARLAVQLAAGLLNQRPVLAGGPVHVDDDLLYALLSFAPLSTRQQLRFVRGCVERITRSDDRRQLAELLMAAMAASAHRVEHRYSDYRPATRAVAARHGIYAANVLLLIVAFAGTVTAGQLFPDADDAAGTWHRHALLWRSAMTEPEWTDFAMALSTRQTWTATGRELEVSLSDGHLDTPPVDVYWHFREQPGHIIWRRPYTDEVMHKMHIAGGTNDSAVRHALEPLTQRLGETIMTFVGGGPDEPATSFAHDLMNLWLCSSLPGTTEQLTDAYQRCVPIVRSLRIWGPQFLDVALLVLRQLSTDLPRLPEDSVRELLFVARGYAASIDDRDGPLTRLINECAQTTIPPPHL